MDIKEQLKDIKTQLRLSMNGAVSQSMREKGLVYCTLLYTFPSCPSRINSLA